VNYAVVGAFVLILSTAIIAGVLWLASGGAFQKKFDLYLAIEDESVAGLNLNAPVKYSGVDVGKVQEILLDPTNPGRVRLLFAIERGTPIKEDTVAVLKTQGLTGIAYVELGGSTKEAAPLKVKEGEEYPVIRTKPSLSTRLETVLTTVLEKLDHTTSNIDSLLSKENQLALQNSLRDIATIAHTVAARKNTIDAGITSAARTFDNTDRATRKIEPLINQISQTAEAIEKTSQEARIVINNANHAVDSVGNDVSRFTTESLPEVQRLLGELNVLAASLRRLSEQTERDPASLIRGRRNVPEGPGETK
jgi:phospholipid/cholesterol/gamma-HCH transport system substrate-binding protein